MRYIYMVNGNVFSSHKKAVMYVCRHFCFNSIERFRFNTYFLNTYKREVAVITKVSVQ